MSRARRTAAAGLVAVALAGCGSTLQDASGARVADQSALGGPMPGGLPTGDGSLAGPPAAGGGASSTGGNGTGGSGLSGTRIDPGATAQPGTAVPRVSVPSGPGVTATRIYVGVVYSTSGDAANQALGANISQGDTKADAQAVIDDINAHGGVAGRKLVPVWFNYDALDARPYAVIDNDACARFTQDNHVFAVAGDGITDNFPACVTKSGALMVATASAIIGPDQAFFDRFPYLFNTGYLTQDRMMAEQVRALVRMNYFSGWNSVTGAPAATPAEVGIISFDTPSWNHPLDRVMLPRLRAAGHPVDPANVQRVTYPSDNDQVASSVAQIQSAVLKFRQNGVTHVIVLDGNGSMTLHMLNNMRSQRYFPRLGVNSATGVQALKDGYAQSTKSFNGAVGLGWSPTLDLPAGKGDAYFNARTRACISMIERRTGQRFPDTNSASIALGYCDQLYLLAAAINRATGALDRDSVAAAIEAMRGSFPSAGTYGLFFSPTRHDGVEYGYDMRFDGGCGCVQYVRGPFRIPSL
ncbi:MAG TPA: ABC transporter substrate-binding protein [Mycobacteriales bacterium]|nr:ABC transporter substrate-binding protein [Mycobacteriales bacterium]